MNANSSKIKYRIDNSSFVNALLQNGLKYNNIILSLLYFFSKKEKKKTQGRPVGFTQDDASFVCPFRHHFCELIKRQ